MKSLLNGILISLFSRPHPHIILLNLRRVMTTIDSNEHTLILLLYRLRSRIRINSGSKSWTWGVTDVSERNLFQ